jgi:hypothetical protein
MRQRKEVIKLSLALVIIILLVLFFIYNNKIKKDKSAELKNNGVITTAIVVNQYYLKSYYLVCKYKVQQNNIEGHFFYSETYGDISIGDTILIKYLKSEPRDVKEIFLDSNNKLIKHHKK